MLFSVLVPVYNQEKYLSECIESIIRQTETDFELILVDDGSKDSSGRICDEYQNRFPEKIKVIHQENKGSLLARRITISESKGEYCIFVDSDDYIRKDMLEIIKRTINETKADLVIFNYLRVTDDGKKLRRAQIFSDTRIFTGENKTVIYERLLKDDSLNNLAIKAFKNELIDMDFDYDTVGHVNVAEDLLETLPIVTNAKRIVYINEDLYFYRQNSSSITKTFNPVWYDSITYVYKQLAEHMERWKLNNEHGMNLFRQRHIDMVKEGIRQLSLSGCNWDIAKRREFLEMLASSRAFIDAFDNAALTGGQVRWGILLALLRKKRILFLLHIIDTKRFFARGVKKCG
jgi:glycosyltransferase involved in cell wall biosynthesis